MAGVELHHERGLRERETRGIRAHERGLRERERERDKGNQGREGPERERQGESGQAI